MERDCVACGERRVKKVEVHSMQVGISCMTCDGCRGGLYYPLKAEIPSVRPQCFTFCWQFDSLSQ